MLLVHYEEKQSAAGGFPSERGAGKKCENRFYVKTSSPLETTSTAGYLILLLVWPIVA